MRQPGGRQAGGRPAGGGPVVPFGSNEVRLSPGQCVLAGAIVLLVLALLPVLWERIEPLDVPADWRMPYDLSTDYWLFARRAREAAAADQTLVVGDSVVWGHYVRSDQTLSHYLNRAAGRERFANLGVDGIHPAALAGLLEHYGGAISGRRVVLHANLLWMSSPRHDLTARKEFAFNHPELVPQFFPRIPCYRETVSQKLEIAIHRNVGFFAWATHVRLAYFGGLPVGPWTVEHPYGNPLRAVTLELPSGRRPASPPEENVPWTQKDIPRFDAPWVELNASFQWQSLQRALATLTDRGNRVFVLVGPFNEHMLTDDSREVHGERLAGVAAWLTRRGVPHYVPPALPSDRYADASHPLAEGYARIAEQLFAHEAFARFDGRAAGAPHGETP